MTSRSQPAARPHQSGDLLRSADGTECALDLGRDGGARDGLRGRRLPIAAQGEALYLTEFLDPAEDASEWGFPEGATEVTEDGYTAAFTEGALTGTLDGAPNAWLYPDDLELPADQAVEARIASRELVIFAEEPSRQRVWPYHKDLAAG